MKIEVYQARWMMILSLLAMMSVTAASQGEMEIRSRMYSWEEGVSSQRQWGMITSIMQGTSRDFRKIEVSGIILHGGKQFTEIHESSDEILLLVIEGSILLETDDDSEIMSPGSAALLMPGTDFMIENTNSDDGRFFLIAYSSRSEVDLSRGLNEGGSQLFAWSSLSFHKHDKGGLRRYFNRPTAMSKRFEMHATTLDPGLKSHEPHTHRAAEIILMIAGKTEEQIGEDFYQGSVGDFYFLESEIPHAIQNIGSEPALYYAFQFE